MAGEWSNTVLGEHIELLTGFAFKSRDFIDVPGVRLARGDNVKRGVFDWSDGKAKFWTAITSDLEQYRLAAGDVLIGMDGSRVGENWVRVSDADLPCLLVQRVARLRVRSTLDQRFLRFLVGTPPFAAYVKAVHTGTSIPHISGGQIRQFPIVLPQLKEQQAIACILGALDDKIELNRRRNRTLESMTRAKFQSWFVDFDPVRAKVAGRKPAVMSKEIAALFPTSFEESALGQIPSGWRAGSVLELADLLSGGTPKTSEPSYWDGEIPWASAKDVSQCGEPFLINTERSITRSGLENSATQVIPAFCSVVVARGATTGRLTMFGSDIAMNQTCYALRSKFGTPRFLFLLLQREIGALVHAAHGSVFDTITTATFRASHMCLPDLSAASAFEKFATPLYDQIHNSLQQSRTLSALRDALLPKLISGELRVPDAERIVGRAV